MDQLMVNKEGLKYFARVSKKYWDAGALVHDQKIRQWLKLNAEWSMRDVSRYN